jgi:hypothetical protein
MKAQISVEYLIIIAVAIGILIPGVLFFYSYSSGSNSGTTSSQLNEIGLRMVAVVKSTYALGIGARQTVEFVMPSTVTRAYADNAELVFVYETPNGPSEAVFFSTIGMNTTLSNGDIAVAHPGLTRYRFISLGKTVLINETT